MIRFIQILGLGGLLLASGTTSIDPGVAPPTAPEPTAATAPVAEVMVPPLPEHEAFPGPVIGQPRPPPIVLQEPPLLPEEAPTDPQPPGDNMRWIGGYWAWDGSSNFRWVSGLWADLPPGRQWVAGHWARCGDGWQRVPGYWMQYAREAVPLRHTAQALPVHGAYPVFSSQRGPS